MAGWSRVVEANRRDPVSSWDLVACVFRCRTFAPDVSLEVTGRHAAGAARVLAFDCAVLDPAGGPPLVEGRLMVLPMRPGDVPPEWAP